MTAADPLRILMIPQKRHPCDHAMLESVYARELPARGHRVVWVMQGATPRDAGEEDWHGTTVHVVPGERPGALRGLRRAVGWARVLARAARLGRRTPFDVVQVRNAVSAGLLALWLRRRTGSRFVYQWSFPIPEAFLEAADQGRVKAPVLRRPLARLQIRWRHGLLRRADLVLAISDLASTRLVAAGVDRGRVVPFPMGAEDTEPATPEDIARMRREHAPDASRIVVYVGSIAPERQLAFLVRVTALLPEDVMLLMVGPAFEGEDVRLLDEAAGLGLASRIRILARVPRADVHRYLAMADVAVSPVPPVPLYEASSPTKAVEALAVGTPVVATPIADQERLVRESAGGRVAPFEEEAFAAAIVEVIRDPARGRAMGTEGRLYVLAHRSYRLMADRVEEAYRRVLSGVHV